WGVLHKSEPPKVGFARVKRQTLVSNLPTNGKVEPLVWQAVRTETSGTVSRVLVEDGQTVAAGAVLATISEPGLQAEIEAAEAKVAEARANQGAFEAGGRPADMDEIENNMQRARVALDHAGKTQAEVP